MTYLSKSLSFVVDCSPSCVPSTSLYLSTSFIFRSCTIPVRLPLIVFRTIPHLLHDHFEHSASPPFEFSKIAVPTSETYLSCSVSILAAALTMVQVKSQEQRKMFMVRQQRGRCTQCRTHDVFSITYPSVSIDVRNMELIAQFISSPLMDQILRLRIHETP